MRVLWSDSIREFVFDDSRFGNKVPLKAWATSRPHGVEIWDIKMWGLDFVDIVVITRKEKGALETHVSLSLN